MAIVDGSEMNRRKISFIFLFSCLLLLHNLASSSLGQINSEEKEKTPCDFTEFNPVVMKHIPSEVILKMFKPEYPEKARKLKLFGSAFVKILINEDGLVEKACLIRGDEVFRDEVEKAALKWEFKPGFGLAFHIERKETSAKRYAYTFINFTFEPSEDPR